MRVTLTVNGRRVEADDVWEGESLLYVLRERLGLPGSKNACEQGECGSCTVKLDGVPVCSCLVAAGQAQDREVVTVEGLAPARATTPRTTDPRATTPRTTDPRTTDPRTTTPRAADDPGTAADPHAADSPRSAEPRSTDPAAGDGARGSGAPALAPVQQAFLDAGAVQCGFCTPGLLVATDDLLERNPQPTDSDIREALSGNLCRCTGYEKILDAVRLAAARTAPRDGQR